MPARMVAEAIVPTEFRHLKVIRRETPDNAQRQTRPARIPEAVRRARGPFPAETGHSTTPTQTVWLAQKPTTTLGLTA